MIFRLRLWLSDLLSRWSMHVSPSYPGLRATTAPPAPLPIVLFTADGKREIHYVDPAKVQFVAHVNLATLADIRADHEAHAEEWRRLGERLSGSMGGDAKTRIEEEA